jgi:TatA/E family protein of Tat protein translocase
VPFDGALSPLHWLIIGVVALLVLGPDRLPQAGREAATAYRFIREAGSAITNELSGLLGVDDRATDDRVTDANNDGRPVDWVEPRR